LNNDNNDSQEEKINEADSNDKEAGDEENGMDDEAEDEDSDEDNVNVVIGDISKSAPTYTNLNIHKRGGLVPSGKVHLYISL
jgi:cobalamin biosynthesis protein CobT